MLEEILNTFRLNTEGKLERLSNRLGFKGQWTLVPFKPNTHDGYCSIGLGKKVVKYHHIVWIVCNKTLIPKGCIIHHLDEVKTNNSIENLQLLTHAEHREVHKDISEKGLQLAHTVRRAKGKGYCFCKNGKTYRVTSQVNKVYMTFGCYKEEADAKKVSLIVKENIPFFKTKEQFQALITQKIKELQQGEF